MDCIRVSALIIGGLAIATGPLWLGRGTGLVLWPQDSFMLADRTWARNGLLLGQSERS